MVGVKYVIVVQQDGLDEAGFKETLEKYGKVTEVEDNELDEDTPVKMFYMDSDFSKFIKIKLDLNCVSAEVNRYVLFPMATLRDKKLVMNERG